MAYKEFKEFRLKPEDYKNTETGQVSDEAIRRYVAEVAGCKPEEIKLTDDPDDSFVTFWSASGCEGALDFDGPDLAVILY